MTISEQRFLEYCERNKYAVRAIPRQPNVRKTADFRVTAGSSAFVVEIKELIASSEDRGFVSASQEVQATPRVGAVCERARSHIREAAAQLRPYRSEKVPLVVVLYDNIQIDGRRPVFPYADLQTSQIDAAMYGAARPQQVCSASGGKRSSRAKEESGSTLTRAERCYVSAVGVLYDIPSLFMVTYHNFYATVPLPLPIFSGERDIHLKKAGDPEQTPGAWERVVPPPGP